LEFANTNQENTKEVIRMLVKKIGEYLTVNDVAKLLNVSPKTVYRWCSAGKLPHIKIGGSLRFKQSDLLALLEKRDSATTRK